MWRAVAWGFLLLGCSAAVTEDPASGGTPVPESPGNTFTCTPLAPSTRVRVEMNIESSFSFFVPGAGSWSPGAGIGAGAAVYVIEPTLTNGHRGARVVLEKADEREALSKNQNAWSAAVARGWIRVGEPFSIRHERGAWCWPAANGCDADVELDGFAAAVGLSVDLLDLSSDLAPSLEGQENRGGLSLPLPERVTRRVSLTEPGLTAASREPGYPTSFVFARAADTEVQGTQRSPDGTEKKVPIQARTEVEAVFVVDQRCRVLELARTDRFLLPRGASPISGAGISRTLRWRFTPLGS